MNKLSFVTRVCCWLVNWDPEILKECSRASICQVKKLTFAMMIVLLVWSFNGYSIGSMFLNLPVWACCLMAAVLAFVVWLIENVILLTIGKSFMMKFFRFGLGCLMALLGSTLVDHYFFKEDIETILVADLEEKIKDETIVLEAKYAADMAEKSSQMEQLRLLIEEKDAKIAAKPYLTKKEYQTVATGEFDEKGKPVLHEVSSSVTQIENPLIASRQADQDLYSKYEDQYNESRMRKLNAANEATEKYSQDKHVGFLKMLDATVRVVKQNVWNQIAYGVFFCIMLALELFVLVIKVGEKRCDYELILEQQLLHRNRLIEARQKCCDL